MSALRPERLSGPRPPRTTGTRPLRRQGTPRPSRYRPGRRRRGARGEGLLLVALLAVIVVGGALLLQNRPGSPAFTSDTPLLSPPDDGGVAIAPPAVLADGADPAAQAATLALATYDPAEVSEVWLARDDLWIGALLSAPSQGQGIPLLLTSPDSLSPAAVAALEQLGVERVRILGGVMSSGVEQAVRDLGYEVERIAGSSRAEVATRVAALVRPDADAALLVNGADRGAGSGQPAIGREIAVASYAAAQQLPVLVTWRDVLPQVTRDYLAQAGIGRVAVVGGPQIVADTVLDELRAAGVTVERLDAPSGAALAADVARRRGLTPSGAAAGLVVVDIADEDAPTWGSGLAAAGYSVRADAPVLLVERDRLPSPTFRLLQSLFRSAPVTCTPSVAPDACNAVRSLARSPA